MGADRDLPEFDAATLPPPFGWKGKMIWRTDLGAIQYSSGSAWIAPTYQDPATGALVGGGGTPIARTDLHQGSDQVSGAVQISTTSTAAISTTAGVGFTPAGGVYRTARLTWSNNGGPANGVLYIAANCDNAARGLFASQQAQQRDAQLAIGGAVLLLSPVPIESLFVSADQSYTLGQHSLTCVFGE